MERKKKPSSDRGISNPGNSTDELIAQDGNFHNEKSKSPFTWSSLSLDTWFWEIIALTFSILCFIAIFCVLWVYDGKPSPTLPHGVRLNTVVSILATVSKSSLMFVISAALGQLKWIWFSKRKRRLHDMQSFDDASRGPWGSLTMLIQHRGMSLASVGALITIFSLAYDPFFQQVLSFPIRQIPSISDLGSAKQAQAFLSPDIMRGANGTIRNAVNAGIWADGNDFTIDPTCPSANCSWPLFRSVGLCSKCEDVTSSATLVGCDDLPYSMPFRTTITETDVASCSVSLPGRKTPNTSLQFIPNAGTNSEYNMTMPGNIIWEIDSMPANKSYMGVQNPLLLLGYAELGLPENNDNRPEQTLKLNRVTECIVSLCTRVYDVSVISGVSSTNLSDPDFGIIRYDTDYRNACWTQTTSDTVSTLLDFAALGELDETPNTGMEKNTGLQFCWAGDLAPDLSVLFGQQNYTSTIYAEQVSWKQPSLDTTGVSDSFQRATSIGIEAVLGNITASLTKLGLQSSSRTVDGTVALSEVYVSVDWAWMTLPALILGLSIFFLLTTIAANAFQMSSLWKTSALPVLYHGLEDGLLDAREYFTLGEMERSIKAVDVSLRLCDKDGTLLLRK